MSELQISPKSVSISAGQTQSFEAFKDGKRLQAGVTWSHIPSSAGALSQEGVYAAPSRIFRSRKVTVIAKADGESAVAAIELTPHSFWVQFLGGYLLAVFLILLIFVTSCWHKLCPRCEPDEVRLSPPVVTLTPGEAQAFSANTTVSPKLGIYTAPRPLQAPGKVVIKTRSEGELAKVGRAEVFLSPDLGLSIQPVNVSVPAGGSVDLTARLSRLRTPDAAGAEARPEVEWLDPELGSLTPLDPTGKTARFSVEAAGIERPVAVKILARTLEGTAVAGAWVTVLPDSHAADSCTQDGRTNVASLLLLLALMGALGGMIHGISSFTTFVGNREFLPSWLWWYIFKPFLAALVAIVVFLVFRAGFGVGSFSLAGADCLRVAAFAGLIGLFHEPATLKLKDIFETLFTPRNDPRKDEAGKAKNAGPKIERLEPDKVTEKATVTVLTIHGSGFAPSCQVMVGSDLRKPQEPVTETKLVVPLDPRDIEKPGKVQVVVFNKPPDGEASNPMFLEVEQKPS